VRGFLPVRPEKKADMLTVSDLDEVRKGKSAVSLHYEFTVLKVDGEGLRETGRLINNFQRIVSTFFRTRDRKSVV
jgi:hypothetical protein